MIQPQKEFTSKPDWHPEPLELTITFDEQLLPEFEVPNTTEVADALTTMLEAMSNDVRVTTIFLVKFFIFVTSLSTIVTKM
ncbi:hypothetical protein SDC9_108564 [bioreactor metagenome]|uniref:Uncharacterized protein n=1 Tax=bioreactor metagenome TaxID=1076179 RepID=A0A645BIZ1_9ZZZZ